MLMAENLRTGFVWDTFMRSREAQRGLAARGFSQILLRMWVLMFPRFWLVITLSVARDAPGSATRGRRGPHRLSSSSHDARRKDRANVAIHIDEHSAFRAR